MSFNTTGEPPPSPLSNSSISLDEPPLRRLNKFAPAFSPLVNLHQPFSRHSSICFFRPPFTPPQYLNSTPFGDASMSKLGLTSNEKPEVRISRHTQVFQTLNVQHHSQEYITMAFVLASIRSTPSRLYSIDPAAFRNPNTTSPSLPMRSLLAPPHTLPTTPSPSRPHKVKQRNTVSCHGPTR